MYGKALKSYSYIPVFVDAPIVIDVPDATSDDLNKYDSAAVPTHTPGQAQPRFSPVIPNSQTSFFKVLKSFHLRD
jgi:hypothetical protein